MIVKVIDLLPGTVRPIRTVAAAELSEDSFWHEFVCSHTPVLIRGAAAHWPALEHWSRPGYLEARSDGVHARYWQTFNPAPVLEGTAAMVTRPLVECLAEMRAAAADVTRSIPGLALPAAWAGDVGALSFLGAKYERPPYGYPGRRLFVYKNASTEWHYHTIDETITCQLVGSKRFSLFRPGPETWRQVEPLVRSNLHHLPCGRAFFHGDAGIVKFEGIAGPGDAIYIPPYWWHGVDTADDLLGVTLASCFRSPLRRFGDWSDPVTRELVGDVFRIDKLRFPLLLGVLAASTISRKLGREAWWPLASADG